MNLDASAFGGLHPRSGWSAFSPEAIQGFDPEQLLNLDASAFGGFTPDQVGAFSPEAIQGFDPEQLLNLDALLLGASLQIRLVPSCQKQSRV